MGRLTSSWSTVIAWWSRGNTNSTKFMLPTHLSFTKTFCLFPPTPPTGIPAIHVCNNHLSVIWFLKLSFESKFVEIKLKFAETWVSMPPNPKSEVEAFQTKVLSSLFHFPIILESVSTRLSKTNFLFSEVWLQLQVEQTKLPSFFYFTFIQFFGILCDSFDLINRLPLQFFVSLGFDLFCCESESFFNDSHPSLKPSLI